MLPFPKPITCLFPHRPCNHGNAILFLFHLRISLFFLRKGKVLGPVAWPICLNPFEGILSKPGLGIGVLGQVFSKFLGFSLLFMGKKPPPYFSSSPCCFYSGFNGGRVSLIPNPFGVISLDGLRRLHRRLRICLLSFWPSTLLFPLRNVYTICFIFPAWGTPLLAHWLSH